jgi:hypothetical protein
MATQCRVFLSIVYTLLVLSLTGCAGPNLALYGGIIPDGEVTESFEGYRIDPDLNYYISGSDMYPNAIMGLGKAYTLDSTLWKKVEMTPGQLREFVTNMRRKVLVVHGFALVDNRGNRIGVWYSLLSATTSLRMEDDRTVVIPTPALNTYEETERWPFRRIY